MRKSFPTEIFLAGKVDEMKSISEHQSDGIRKASVKTDTNGYYVIMRDGPFWKTLVFSCLNLAEDAAEDWVLYADLNTMKFETKQEISYEQSNRSSN